MPTSIRLDPATDQALDELAHRRSETKSQLVRRAIEDLLARENFPPYERAADLIGAVSGGPPDLSEGTGQGLRELLASRDR